MTPYVIALAALALLLARTRKKRSLTTKPKSHGSTLRHTTAKKNKDRKKEDEQ